MSKHNSRACVTEARIDALPLLPRETRGFRREREKRERKLKRVLGALIVGIDLACERQAVSYRSGENLLGRARFTAHPRDLHLLLPQARAVQERAQLERILFAMEPAGHYWKVAAEGLERHQIDYVTVQPLSVKRAREETRFTPDRSDPKDADLIAQLTAEGKFIEARLPSSRPWATLDALARDYLLVRKLSAADRTRLTNFWDQFLPEHDSVFKETDSATALAISLALLPLSELSGLTEAQWCARVREHAPGRIQISRARAVFALLKAAQADPIRRSTDGLPFRIRSAAQRRSLLEGQKASLRAALFPIYEARPEAVYLDSIQGSEPLYNALVLGLIGDLSQYDDPRTLVKLAGSEVLERTSGEYLGVSRISHRGRSLLRSVAYQQARFLVRRNEDFANRFYALKNRRGLNDLQAYTAIANSYLRTVHAVVRKQTPYHSDKRRKEERGK
jgi:transposase